MKSNKGFTMAELLITVVVIAVIVAISIPIFSSQLEKSREATDLGNVRSAYGQIMTAVAADEKDTSQYSITVSLKQKKDGWTSNPSKLVIGDINYSDNVHWLNEPKSNGTCQVYYDLEKHETFIDWGGAAKQNNPDDIDYNSNISIGKYIFSLMQKELDLYNAGEQTDFDFNKLFNNKCLSTTKTITLPNGKTVSVIIYNRDYDQFKDKPTRLTTGDTASLIYNKTTGRLSTIIYYNGSNYSSWTNNSDYDKWSSDDDWKNDDY